VCGLPGIFYSDNGSDFKSKHIQQVAADLKIQLKNSIPGKPRGRGRIERFFLTVNQLLLMNLSGYCPPKTAYPEATMTLEQFTPLFEQFLVDDYHNKIHSSINQTPIERWIGKGFLPQLPVSLEKLDLLLLTVVRPRKVRRDGIHFQNLIYIEPTLAAYVGESVIIRYDPRDLAEVRVYHNNAFLCRAICQELAGETVSLKDIIRARQKRKRELRKTIAERKSLMDTLLEKPKREASQKAATKTKKNTSKKHGLKLYKND
jgi:putative transposase